MSTTAPTAFDLDAFCARYLAAWNDHDAEAMADLVTDDVVWEDPALPAPARGPAAVQDFMREAWVAFPDLRFDESDHPHRTAGGDQVAWRWRMRGTNTGPIDPPGFAPTGRRWELDGVDLHEYRDGRVCKLRIVFDMMTASRQLGLMPTVGGRAERALAMAQRSVWRVQQATRQRRGG